MYLGSWLCWLDVGIKRSKAQVTAGSKLERLGEYKNLRNYTVSQNGPTLKLSVTFSNLNPF